MAAIQRVVVDRRHRLVLAESGNSFAWATHCLRFRDAGRYRVSTGVGSMGHCAAGVVGAAFASGHPAVAIVGDGAMLMNNEINTAVKLGAPAVWIVLNDSRYNMCEQGMAVLGLADAGIPEVDFAMLAQAMGAAGEVASNPNSTWIARWRPPSRADAPSCSTSRSIRRALRRRRPAIAACARWGSEMRPSARTFLFQPEPDLSFVEGRSSWSPIPFQRLSS